MVVIKKFKSCLDSECIKFNFTNSYSITNFNLVDLILIITFHTDIPSFQDTSDMPTFCFQNFTKCPNVMKLIPHGRKKVYGVACPKDTCNC